MAFLLLFFIVLRRVYVRGLWIICVILSEEKDERSIRGM